MFTDINKIIEFLNGCEEVSSVRVLSQTDTETQILVGLRILPKYNSAVGVQLTKQNIQITTSINPVYSKAVCKRAKSLSKLLKTFFGVENFCDDNSIWHFTLVLPPNDIQNLISACFRVAKAELTIRLLNNPDWS